MESSNDAVFFEPNPGTTALNQPAPDSDEQSLNSSPLNRSRNGVSKDCRKRFAVGGVHARMVSENGTMSRGFSPKVFAPPQAAGETSVRRK
jgi:hypothetical protein